VNDAVDLLLSGEMEMW